MTSLMCLLFPLPLVIICVCTCSGSQNRISAKYRRGCYHIVQFCACTHAIGTNSFLHLNKEDICIFKYPQSSDIACMYHPKFNPTHTPPRLWIRKSQTLPGHRFVLAYLLSISLHSAKRAWAAKRLASRCFFGTAGRSYKSDDHPGSTCSFLY